MNHGVLRNLGEVLHSRPWAMVVGACLLFPGQIQPAVIQVSGACDLVEAIDNANADSVVHGDCASGSGADEIRLTGNVVLTAVDNTTDGDNGLPSLISEITIAGGGFSVSRDMGSPPFRLFHVGPGGIATFNDLQITDGLLTGTDGSGGAIFNLGDLTLSNSTVSGSAVDVTSMAYGGGIYNQGTLLLVSSSVSANSIDGQYAYGGGIFNDVGSPIDLEFSSLVGNTASGQYVGGAGLDSFYRPDISHSTVADNVGYSTGGPFPTVLGVGIEATNGLSLSFTTVSGNTATAAGLGYQFLFGGGLKTDGIVNISSSTISGNSLSATASVGAAYGGGINQAGTGTISFSTLSGNSATGNYSDGGGLFVNSNASLALVSSLVANSGGNNCAAFGSLIDAAGNQADDGSCASIPATLTGLDPLLMDNGGPSRTHALDPFSSAVDVLGDCGVPTDQRGVPREDLQCDAGAFELIPCSAADGPILFFDTPEVVNETTIEVCISVVVGPGVEIFGPNGHLILRSGQKVELRDGTSVGLDGRLTVEIDTNLNM